MKKNEIWEQRELEKGLINWSYMKPSKLVEIDNGFAAGESLSEVLKVLNWK